MLHRPNDVNYPQALNLPGAGAWPIPTEDSQLSESSRVALLRELLGEANCRNMGIYEIPQGFRLSVVIPVYNPSRMLLDAKIFTASAPARIRSLTSARSSSGSPSVIHS